MKINELFEIEVEKYQIVGQIKESELVENQINIFDIGILANPKSFDIPIIQVSKGRENITKYLKLPKESHKNFSDDIQYFGKFIYDNLGRKYFIMECDDDE